MGKLANDPEAVRYPVFRDDKGNRFVFPGLYSYEDRRADWGHRRMTCAALRVAEEKFNLLVVPDDEGMLNFPHVVADAHSPGFAHGGDVVWIIGGPEFDAIFARAA